MRRVLVVANRTLCDQQLLDELNRYRGEGGVAFHVLVLAVKPPWRWALAGPDVDPLCYAGDIQLNAKAEAEGRLGALLDTLAIAGVPATGEIREAAPVAAVDDILRDRPFDEIVVSTYPQRISRWLGGDVVDRIRSNTELPVKHVAPQEEPRER